MTRFLFCMLFFLTALISGCATQMDVALNATPDPEYHFDRKATVLVTSASGSDENALNARYYLRDMVNALKDRGYQEVYTDASLPKNHAPIKMTVSLDVGSRQVTYRHRVWASADQHLYRVQDQQEKRRSTDVYE